MVVDSIGCSLDPGLYTDIRAGPGAPIIYTLTRLSFFIFCILHPFFAWLACLPVQASDLYNEMSFSWDDLRVGLLVSMRLGALYFGSKMKTESRLVAAVTV